jgi:2-amino-5-formylamino-6-ribosylaminopyrimidin-4(3H)-one 5'-monophosphate deformylase
MIGLKEARNANKNIENCARELQEEGICIDKSLGDYLLKTAVKDVISDVKAFLSQ